MEGVLPTAPTDGDAPPPYTTLPRSPSEVGPVPSWLSPGAAFSGVGYTPTGMKLGYMDFVPRIVRRRMFKDDEYENFETLVARANNWLEEHRAIYVISCETLSWSGVKKKQIYSDSTVCTRSNNAAVKTYFMRGLRLWYFTSPFPDAQAPTGSAIQVRTFIPRKNENFKQLMNRVNSNISTDQLGGRIITIETVKFHFPAGQGSYSASLVRINQTFWRETPDMTRLYVLGVRVFASVDGQEQTHVEKIGYKDFIPEKNQRNQENRGYEVFYDMIQRATQWVARQQGVRFLNVQTLAVKLKKGQSFEERCLYKEHLCARNRVNFLKGSNKRTKYLQITRIFYCVRMSTLREEFPATRLTYKTFAPMQTNIATRETGPTYESMRQLLDRISQWLQVTGARAFCFETVPVRQIMGPTQSLGAEATYSQTSASNPPVERWMYNIRIYLEGEYMEPPGAVGLVAPPTY